MVVDPGSGDVWSACISFAGTITGAEALALAADLIPGLERAFARPRALAEDVEDQLGAVEDLQLEHPFQVGVHPGKRMHGAEGVPRPGQGQSVDDAGSGRGGPPSRRYM